MKIKLLPVAGIVAVATTSLHAQTYFLSGDHNGWNATANVMTDNGDGSYYLTTTGHIPGATHEWLVITSPSYNPKWPGSNARSKYDTSGNFTFRWYPGLQNDGWNPLQDRVGYDDPGVGWEVMGSFNSFATPVAALTNMGGGLYEGAYVVPVAGTYDYKFRKVGDWDVRVGPGFGNDGNISMITTNPNQLVTFRLDLPHGRYLAGDPAPAGTNKVTFFVDMGAPVQEYSATSGFDTNSDTLYVRGDFNGWTASAPYQLFPVVPGSTLYSNTVEIVAYGGTTINYKFFGDPFPGEESTLLTCGATRTLVITSTDMIAPLTYWSDRQVTDPTNTVTMQVDMSVQLATGAFDPGIGDQVHVRGTFNNYGQLAMTSLPPPNTNIYTADLTVNNWPIGACIKYKFFNSHAGAPNGGWESPLGTGGNDRQFNILSSAQTNAALFFNDVEICDIIEQTNYVTFSINMTNAVGVGGSPAYDGSQTVYLNGNFTGWHLDTVASYWGDNPNPNFALAKVGGTDVHAITLPFPPGQNLRLVYKFSMGGQDNEAAMDQNHVRYIRTLPGQINFSMPLDAWTGDNTSNVANLEEPELGYITVNTGTPGVVQLQWLGLKCAGLQTTPSLTAPWVPQTVTDGLNATNWPASGDGLFFRVARPNTP